MQTLGDPRALFWRVIKMAKANDVNLSDALEDHQITVSEYADMVTGCRGCEQVARCDRLLAAAEHLREAPDYCVNRDTFKTLRKA